MVDPLLTFAAAGNALQFIQLGVSIISKAIEYSHGGGSNEFQALKDCAGRLAAANVHIQSSIERKANESLPPGPARALRCANLECLRLSKELVSILDQLGFNKSCTLWNSVKLALKTHVNRDRLDTLCTSLEHARANLMLSILVLLLDQSAAHQDYTNEQNRLAAQQALRIATESKTMRDDIANLNSYLSSNLHNDFSVSERIEYAIRKHKSDLTDISNRLSKHVNHLDDGLKAVARNVRQVLSLLDREILAKQRVVESLRYSRLYHRRARISRAHSNTYQWIFRPRSLGNVVWDDFIQWLTESKQPIYWVSGKPGSGKSTLIRELDERSDELGILHRAVKDGDFLKASFYFWHSGSNDEKSLLGCLRSLIYQLLSQYLDIVAEVISAERWRAAQNLQLPLHEWEEAELAEVLHRIVQRFETNTNLLLFIDGLDEQDASDEQRQEMLQLLESLTKYKNVKACVASRSWNIYRDAFRDCPMLCLEDLTRTDIHLYVSGKLGSDRYLLRLQKGTPQLLKTLSDQIVEKARGVFLWVCLAVRDLLKVLRDGGDVDDLLRELRSIPPELDDYFNRIIETIDPSYRGDASVLLQTALYPLSPDPSEYFVEPAPMFLLVHLHYLNKSGDLSFAAKSCPNPVDFINPQDVEAYLEALERKLTSRSMGLLECDPPLRHDSISSPWNRRVEFLHKTVRDYLTKPATKSILHYYAGGPFDAHMFLCNLFITNMTTTYNPPFTLMYDSTEEFLRQIQARPDGEEASFQLFEKMATSIDRNIQQINKVMSERECRADARTTSIRETLFRWSNHGSNAISLAISLGWKPYLEARLTREAIRRKAGRPLLDYALRPSLPNPRIPDREIVRTLLNHGASPDVMIHKTSGIPVWTYYLVSLCFVESMEQATVLETIADLLIYGVRTRVTETQFSHRMRHIPRCWRTPRKCRSRSYPNEFAKDRCKVLKLHSATGAEKLEPHLYSFLEVLQSLCNYVAFRKGDTKDPLFSEDDIAGLQKVVLARERDDGFSGEAPNGVVQPANTTEKPREAALSQAPSPRPPAGITDSRCGKNINECPSSERKGKFPTARAYSSDLPIFEGEPSRQVASRGRWHDLVMLARQGIKVRLLWCFILLNVAAMLWLICIYFAERKAVFISLEILTVVPALLASIG